jgi:hypothetical protein
MWRIDSDAFPSFRCPNWPRLLLLPDADEFASDHLLVTDVHDGDGVVATATHPSDSDNTLDRGLRDR